MNQTMKEFLSKVDDQNIELNTLKTFFEPNVVWDELVTLINNN